MRVNYTKIVATLGPVSDSFSVIEDMVRAGMDVARLNFSHGTYKNFKQIHSNTLKAAKKHKRTVGILQDLQGPKIRLGILPSGGIEIKKGQKISLTTASAKRSEAQIPVQYKDLHKDVKKGETLHIEDGLIQLKITKVSGTTISCTVKNKGVLRSNKGINAPDSKISAKTLTRKDLKDLNFGLRLGIDFVAISFVKSAQDITDLRKLLAKKKASHVKIIAKIERKEAVTNMEDIVKVSDGIMVARGDLGIEVEPERVPIIQKTLIKLCNYHAKPVITATQVLASMVENPTPTRAEISDAANSIFDHTDAIMLSNESAVGKYPVKSVRTLAKTISVVENEQKKHKEILQKHISNIGSPEVNATSLSACELALASESNYLVIYSESGYTANHVAKHRLFKPTIIITPNKHVMQELSLLWGVNQSIQKKLTKNFTTEVKHLLTQKKLAKKGDKIVFAFNAKEKGSIAQFTI
jgi:pyruvate kinase